MCHKHWIGTNEGLKAWREARNKEIAKAIEEGWNEGFERAEKWLEEENNDGDNS